MKLSTDTNRYTTTITSSADFGIQNEDLSHIMGILRSQIYSDKLLAVIREYSTNARDANIEAGYPNTPIDVILPTFANPELSFRDYGNGLTSDEVCNLYVKYGASTKRDSNDYTGCLGIGCKAAFAYGDQFTITSFSGNHVTEWLARIDESKKGTISLLSTRDRLHNEATGVKVSVHIRKQDIDDCVKKAKNFFKYRSKDEIKCNEDIEHLQIHTETDNWIIEDLNNEEQNRGYRFRGGEFAKVFMGGIIYRLDKDQCSSIDNASGLLANNNVILKAPLGSLEIAANRESLEYTDKTKATLNIMSVNMATDLVKLVTKHVASQPTRLAASIASSIFSQTLGDNVSKQLTKDARWNGKELLNEINFGTDTTCYFRKKSWSAQEYRNHKDDGIQRITLRGPNYLVLWDSDNIAQSNATRRIRTLQKEAGWDPMARYYVIRKSNLDKVEPKLEPSDYTDLTNIEPLKAERTIITKADGTQAKAVKISVCHLKDARLKSERLSDEAEPVANEDGKFIYVPLDRFDWQGRTDALDNLNAIEKALSFLGETDITIHGVKKHYLKKLDNNWILLDVHLKSLWDAWLKDHPAEHQALKDTFSEITYDQRWHAPEILVNVKHTEIQYISRIIQMKDGQTLGLNGKVDKEMRATASTLRWLKLFDTESDINDRVTRLNNKYPLLLGIFTSWQQQSNQTIIAQEITKYINCIDS